MGFVLASILKAAEWDVVASQQPMPKSRETNVLLALRALANAFNEATPVSGPDVGWIAPVLGELMKVDAGVLARTHRVALATMAFNLSCVRLKGTVEGTVGERHLALIIMVNENSAYKASLPV